MKALQPSYLLQGPNLTVLRGYFECQACTKWGVCKRDYTRQSFHLQTHLTTVSVQTHRETNVPNGSLLTLSLSLHLGAPGWTSKSVDIGLASCSCLLLMWPFTHLQVLVDMDGNTNDPSWAPILSCFKPGDICSILFLLHHAGKGGARVSH